MRHMTTYRLLDAIVSTGSMRKAAKAMAITPSALNRRVLQVEEEFGVDLFERTSKGLKLTAAGELLIHHVRGQISDLARVQSRIADLKGMRAGHVSIACSQAGLGSFLPDLIQSYREEFPAVTFSVRQTVAAESAKLLANFECDLAIDYDPESQSILRPLASMPQRVDVLMSKTHPLSDEPSLRLYQCFDYPLALATATYGIRRVLNEASNRMAFELRPAIESDNLQFLEACAETSPTITFRLAPLGHKSEPRSHLVSIPLDDKFVNGRFLTLSQLKDRSLSVAAARFAESLVEAMGSYALKD